MELITLKRIYDTEPPFDKNSYFVDRLWPRGIKKERLQGAIWLKDAAPSPDLRKWYHRNLEEWQAFYYYYQQELKDNTAVEPLYEKVKQEEPITLLFASKNQKHNHAIILSDFLLDKHVYRSL